MRRHREHSAWLRGHYQGRKTEGAIRDSRSQHAARWKDQRRRATAFHRAFLRSEEHTSELQSHLNLVCRLLLEKKKTILSRALTTNDARHDACTRHCIRANALR